MAYAVAYQGTFNTLPNKVGATQVGMVQILQKDYSGNPRPLKFGAAPVTQKWQTDDTHAPIKGSSLTLNIQNQGATPITSFYSTADDEFKVRFLLGNDVKFEGFLVQDDCVEDMIDTNHDLTLSANDNLGLLKDVPLDTNAALLGIDLNTRVSIISLLKLCLYSTSLQLYSNIYNNLYETHMFQTQSPFAQTFIDAGSFLNNDDSYLDCYTVLERILARFNASLFQSEGLWNIVRWDELRYGPVRGFAYSPDFNPQGTVVLDTALIGRRWNPETLPFDGDFYPLTGLQQSILRPYKFDKETFNYRTPDDILKNYNLQKLGSLLRDYTIPGGNRVKEYKMPFWFPGGFIIPDITDDRFFIRIVYDPLGNEIERKVTIYKFPTIPGVSRAIHATPIEVSKGDVVQVDFSYKTLLPDNTTSFTIFYLRLFDGVNTYALSETGKWVLSGVGYGFTKDAGIDSATNWINVSLTGEQIPVDGLLTIFLATVSGDTAANNETYYKDIRFTVSYLVNDSTKIIGQIHNTEQDITIKNTEDVEIFSDDSPRNAISGTLFLSSFTGVIQNRTVAWNRRGITEAKRLGQITTGEILFWRSIPRKRLDGTFMNAGQMSLLTVFKYEAFMDLNFIFGSLEIEYQSTAARITAYEQYTDFERPDDETGAYTFTYIYDTK